VSADPKELYSLLIPLRTERLLVPRMCVAEVIAFADAARSRDDAAQFARVSLGQRVLRAETAALAVCAIAQARWGDLRDLGARRL